MTNYRLMTQTQTNSDSSIILEMSDIGNKFDCSLTIDSALSQAEQEIVDLKETIESIKWLKPDCDKTDYALAAGSGALCGIIDIFLVGIPNHSVLGNITDKWFEDRVIGFAKMNKWKGDGLESAIRYLEKKFNIPYDQRGCGDAGMAVFNLTPSNHHFKSLAHNPSLLGLFFSILDQFRNTSHFVSDGELIALIEADKDKQFELHGNSTAGKIWCGFINWIGHLISDMSGSSSSKGRGTGIPSPLWTWINSVIAIKNKLYIPRTQFDKDLCLLAEDLFKKGYDFRFQTTQVIPVAINELFVRLCYMIRRLFTYYSTTEQKDRALKLAWDACKPFNNVSIARMLTVAHGTFCMVDTGDAVIRGFIKGGGVFNPIEFFLRLNIVGVGRFTISLYHYYGEVKRGITNYHAQEEAERAQKDILIVENYREGLLMLKDRYNDEIYLSFIEYMSNKDYINAFAASANLALQRGVPESDVLKTKADIDRYFNN